MARETLIADAKATALGLARAGYRPPPPRRIRVIGDAGQATLKQALINLQGAHQITAHDAVVSGHLARALSGAGRSRRARWSASSTSSTSSARDSCRCAGNRRPATASNTCCRRASLFGTEGTTMREVAILSAVRTAIGRAPRGFQEHAARRSGRRRLARGAAPRRGRAAAVEDLVLGCAHPEAEQGLNVARQVGFLAGLPDAVPAMTINRFCSSGLQSTAIVADRIAAGSIDLGVAGGLESMSLVPMGGAKIALNPAVVEQFPAAYIPMGNTAENVARQFGVSRGDQDAFALASHQKAVAAQARGDFAARSWRCKTRTFDGEVLARPHRRQGRGAAAPTRRWSKLAALKPLRSHRQRSRRQLVAAQRRARPRSC
jgi:hypothetical protein